MAEPNRICFNKNCQKPYYCCVSCEKINSWKRVTCSPECFQAYMLQIEEQEKKKKGLRDLTMDAKRVMIFAPVHQREWILPYYLRNIYNIDYEKKKIRILWIVNNCTDKTFDLLQGFKNKHQEEYESIDIQVWNNSNIGKPVELNEYRDTTYRNKYIYSWLSDLRNRGNAECLKYDCDYLFSCDTDILVKPDILKGLMSFNKKYVAGLIYNGYEIVPDFWKYTNILRKVSEISYQHVNNYHTKNKIGLVSCDFTGAVFLAEKSILPYYIFSADRQGEDLPACKELQKNGVELFASCDHYSQHIMSPKWLKEFENFGTEEDEYVEED